MILSTNVLQDLMGRWTFPKFCSLTGVYVFMYNEGGNDQTMLILSFLTIFLCRH